MQIIDFNGKRVLIIGKHPWAGKTGVITGAEQTCTGKWGLVVELDNGQSCFVFKPENMRIIGGEVSKWWRLDD